MEELYDYTRHRHCISMDLGHDFITSEAININGLTRTIGRFQFKYRTSILYDTTTRNVIARGNEADEANEDPKGFQQGVIYVRNIFSELVKIYSKSEQKSLDNTAQYAVFYEAAVDLLQELLDDYKQELNSLNMDFYYTLVLPTNWDYKTREGLFQPLFVKAGLIHKNDGQGRLVFFSVLELNFQNIQIDRPFRKGVELKHGDQYVMCTVDYQGISSVDLQLVSAQYPAFISAERKWAPQLLKQVHIEMPYGSDQLRLSLIACLKKHCGTTLSSEFIDEMLLIISEGFNFFKSIQISFQIVLSRRPFEHLEYREFERYGLNRREIDAMKSVTMEDIFKHFSVPAEKVFENESSKFLAGTSIIKIKSIFIFYTTRANSISKALWLTPLLEKWTKQYKDELNFFPKLIGYRRCSVFCDIDDSAREVIIKQLVANQMKEFNKRRNPVILPKETTIQQPNSWLKPISFINIDISLTQIKTTLTYLDKDRQVEQMQSIECNMQPLISFIKKSELYQRPILQIPNRLKTCLKKIFGDHLKLYSSYKISVKKRTLVNQVSKLLGRASRKIQRRRILSNYEWIKSRRNRQKEIRRLFLSAQPNLFNQLTANLKVEDLFVSKAKFWGSDSESFTTCHPGYILFFLITYLHCLNKKIEEALKINLGNNWQANNTWYGVSIDKNLLDNVFSSIKNLEQLFFASGILGKDDELRKVKFCTRGEEILPAIQHKYQYLDFRLKSYFIVAQIYSKHIQLSLHQVVKLALPGEDPASIIIQDKIIYIEHVYDTLCKNFMKFIQANCQVNHCATHTNKERIQYDFQSFGTYSNIYRNMRPCIVELLNINPNCNCSISIFLRDIIELGLIPVIESITTDIVASLTDKTLFGNYVPNYIFVFGDPFNLRQGSKIHISYTMIMQKAIDDGVYIKEKDTKTFVLRESVSQLLEMSLPKKKPYMLERFVTGTLCQVSSETFALRVTVSYTNYHYAFTRINSDGDIKNNIAEDGSYFVFIQKGKPISTKGIRIQVDGEHDCKLEILQLESSTNTGPDKYDLLHSDTSGATYDIAWEYLLSNTIKKFVVEYEQISDNLFIKVSRGCMGHINDYIHKPYYQSLNIAEPLTLAYI
ncbi:uncharacterized protein EV154DRAFT_556387 [Mucor mucedo]|uniref:uncharacterized protein n=1 Tax=Mucor mucedo TaxID=29922 RepID=UPI00221F3E69|nr:uncharacterized protein EV154DRAFT_556387 [Mucor mucedo]KAI7873147.1 hypothetical protein EV154DRAFT_556387 [Mucor mucedo]